MPIYEYRCTSCGLTFEKLVPMNISAITILCPQCKSDQVQRMISAPAVHIAGQTSGKEKQAEEESKQPRIKEVFGRKELQEALKSRGY